jgi:hypothetical protein
MQQRLKESQKKISNFLGGLILISTLEVAGGVDLPILSQQWRAKSVVAIGTMPAPGARKS